MTLKAIALIDFNNLRAVPDKVAETAAMTAGNAVHLARLLKRALYPGVADGRSRLSRRG
jgi:hypothetical protein